MKKRSKVTVLSEIPSVDSLLRRDDVSEFLEHFGHQETSKAIRVIVEDFRQLIYEGTGEDYLKIFNDEFHSKLKKRLDKVSTPSLLPVFNLTGTVLHTNLGRAQLPKIAIESMNRIAELPSNLEYDILAGKRGDRDIHIEDVLLDLTGGEAATVVNNNAAAVFLVLNTIANKKELPVSRGELVEIGGSFRVPDIIKKAGAKLIEVGTTNRTHFNDYEEAISNRTGALLKVHASNYSIEGFTNEVTTKDLSPLAHANNLPLIEDLGSGSIIDLAQFGMPKEPTVMESLKNGVDIVTFSGDKLLGGPQAGLIVGRKDLISRIKKNPINRVTRLDKTRIACLSAVLNLYRDPSRLVEKLPTFRLITRNELEIQKIAKTLVGPVAEVLGSSFTVKIITCWSQIGSGSLPIERLKSAGLKIESDNKREGVRFKNLVSAFRNLPRPVIGRVKDKALIFDLRCLEDISAFKDQLHFLR